MSNYDFGKQKFITLNEMGGKEIVNLNNGRRLGVIADSDLLIDEFTGKIVSLLVPEGGGQLKFFGESREIEIPWNTIKIIGNDMIIIESDY